MAYLNRIAQAVCPYHTNHGNLLHIAEGDLAVEAGGFRFFNIGAVVDHFFVVQRGDVSGQFLVCKFVEKPDDGVSRDYSCAKSI